MADTSYKVLMAQIDDHIERNHEYWLEQLARLCAQPSVSAQNVGITECAQLVATMLEEQGFQAEVMPSDGYPAFEAAKAVRLFMIEKLNVDEEE